MGFKVENYWLFLCAVCVECFSLCFYVDILSVFSVNGAHFLSSLLAHSDRLPTSRFVRHLVVFILSDDGLTSGWGHPEGDGHQMCATRAARPSFVLSDPSAGLCFHWCCLIRLFVCLFISCIPLDEDVRNMHWLLIKAANRHVCFD